MNTTIIVLGSGAKPHLPGKFLRICRAKCVYLVAQNSLISTVGFAWKICILQKKKFIFCPNYCRGAAPPPFPTLGGGHSPRLPPHSLRLWEHVFLLYCQCAARSKQIIDQETVRFKFVILVVVDVVHELLRKLKRKRQARHLLFCDWLLMLVLFHCKAPTL